MCRMGGNFVFLECIDINVKICILLCVMHIVTP